MSINCASAGMEQWFMCDKWFALDEGEGLVERTLYENKKMRVTRKKRELKFMITFNVKWIGG